MVTLWRSSSVRASGGRGNLVCNLRSEPPIGSALFTTVRRLLTVFITVVAPSLVISNTLNFSIRAADCLISVSLFISNVTAFVRYGQLNKMKYKLLYIRNADFSFVDPVVVTKTVNNLPTVFNTAVITTLTRVFVDHVLGCTVGIVAPLISNVIIALVNVDLVGINVASYKNNATTVRGNAFNSFRGLNVTTLILYLVILFGHDSGHCLHVNSVVVNVIVNCIISCFYKVIRFDGVPSCSLFGIPIPFGCNISFGFSTVLTFTVICVVATVRTCNSVATGSLVSKRPIRKGAFLGHTRNNVVTSNIGSFVTNVLGSFPGSVFTRGGNVVRLANITDECINCFVTLFLIILNFFPVVNIVFSFVPSPILNKTALLVFNAMTSTKIGVVTSRRVSHGTALIVTVDFDVKLNMRLCPSVLVRFPSTVGGVFSSNVAAKNLTTVVSGVIVEVRRRWT